MSNSIIFFGRKVQDAEDAIGRYIRYREGTSILGADKPTMSMDLSTRYVAYVRENLRAGLPRWHHRRASYEARLKLRSKAIRRILFPAPCVRLVVSPMLAAENSSKRPFEEYICVI